MSTSTATIIRVYAGSVTRYATALVGDWVSLPCDDLAARLHDIDPGTEEWGVFDYECPALPSLHIGEYDSLQHLNDVAEVLAGLYEDDLQRVDALLAYGVDIDAALERYDDVCALPDYVDGIDDYQGIGEYYADMLDVFAGVPEDSPAREYFDYQGYGRDMAIELCLVETDAGVFEISR